MKKISFMIALLGFIMLTSCHHRHGRYRSTTIRMNNDSVSLKIKYAGAVSFNDDSTAIKSISPEGFLSYRKNKSEILAKSDLQGQLTLELNNNGNRLVLDEKGKTFLSDAVKEMIAQGVKSGNRERQN